MNVLEFGEIVQFPDGKAYQFLEGNCEECDFFDKWENGNLICPVITKDVSCQKGFFKKIK